VFSSARIPHFHQTKKNGRKKNTHVSIYDTLATKYEFKVGFHVGRENLVTYGRLSLWTIEAMYFGKRTKLIV
jgi:hypothetical protein